MLLQNDHWEQAGVNCGRMARKPGKADKAKADFLSAVRHGDLYTVRWYLEKGVNVNAIDDKGRTAVHWAAHHNQPEVLKVLIAAGGRIEPRNPASAEDMSYARQHHPAIAEILSQVYSERRGPLIDAVRSGDIDAVRAHLAAGVDVRRTDENGLTALHGAARMGRTDIVKELIKAGANVNSRHKQLSPLNLATLGNHADTVAELIRAAGPLHHKSVANQHFFKVSLVPAGDEPFIFDADLLA